MIKIYEESKEKCKRVWKLDGRSLFFIVPL